MPAPTSTFSSLAAALGIALLVCGCASRTESFPGKSRDQVWTALLRAAEEPIYTNWHVIENDVWGYESDGRIEIWRMLRRFKDPGGQVARLEDRDWTITVTLEPTDPPSALFDVRQITVPSHGWEEADNYFKQVWALLGGRPVEGAQFIERPKVEQSPASAASPEPVPEPAPDPAAPPVDIPD